MMLPPFDCVVLDMDGLVLDTERTYRAAWRHAVQDLGYRLDAQFWDSLVGLQYRDVEDRLVTACEGKLSLPKFRDSARIHWYRNVMENGIAIKPGFWRLFDCVNELGLAVCLATNSQLKNAEECLELAGLGGLFGLIVSRDHVKRGKPAPDIFEEAARRMKVPASRCLVVEDSDVGIKAASRAGAIPLMVPDSVPPSEQSRRLAFRILGSLAEVATLIRQGQRIKTSDKTAV